MGQHAYEWHEMMAMSMLGSLPKGTDQRALRTSRSAFRAPLGCLTDAGISDTNNTVN
jgi:hypothetical protein